LACAMRTSPIRATENRYSEPAGPAALQPLADSIDDSQRRPVGHRQRPGRYRVDGGDG
jgi:hypothetical protein